MFKSLRSVKRQIMELLKLLKYMFKSLRSVKPSRECFTLLNDLNIYLSNFKQFHYFQHDYYRTNFCLYRIDPPDDEHQACSKHVEAYY